MSCRSCPAYLLNPHGKHSYNRSDHRVAVKDRIRFMTPNKPASLDQAYPEFVSQLVGLLEQARRNSARSVNALMTATYWEIGRRIVEQEQRGQKRAQYGKALLHRLAGDLTARFGKGFSERNLLAMREFFLAWSIPQTASAEGLNRRGAEMRSRIRRHRLRYPQAWLGRPRFPCLGPITCGSSPSRIGKPAHSTKKKLCEAAGRSVNLTARSRRNSSSAPSYRETRQR